ncbi:MAG: cysteine--tRNA ligase [Bacteroidales bacterium]|nr:cysteine--tRNA ligase [Bacteroidales bacterium]MDT8431201.1 cysteine--tRNA ligase [Bacteroidales bacterium]
MTHQLYIYNTIHRKKELFIPANPPFAGLYACGPTVYGDAHLGHARQAVTFDVLFRVLSHLGYKVRYVRNITDVGHLENDADEGEDKIAKKARLEQLEPMEVVQHYMNAYHRNMDELGVLRPGIEPRASGHIIEQQDLVRRILKAGYAYEVNGSVYFDVEKYAADHSYGKLSGRKTEDLLSNTRTLDGQSEKKSPLDFALWKKAEPQHIMRWPSEWSDGFPGWHLECSAMSTKYLGETIDIHGGGMDLLFPHHECEIAQNVAGYGHESVRYWMHNNMITINGQKMGRSLGNFITLDELFSGNHKLLKQAFDPMTIRFFILQAHYRSTLDFSSDALAASEKGLQRLFAAMALLEKMETSSSGVVNAVELEEKCVAAMLDDLNTPLIISALFDGARTINSLHEKRIAIDQENLDLLKKIYHTFVFDVLGLQPTGSMGADDTLTADLVNYILNLRLAAKARKDFETSDQIRDTLQQMGITVKDRKDGFDWEITNK